ncbi:MAG: class I SAM-dependent methyltransferase [Gemmatimonadales bacterium]
MILTPDQMRALYGRLAPFYDAAVLPFRALGLDRHRRLAVRSLALRPGDVVLDLGCGTGLNFPALHEAVGSRGRIIGVDLTAEMLDKARERAERAGFENVELIQADLATQEMPAGMAGALATYVLEAVPGYDSVVRAIAAALPAGGRLASYGLKRPDRWPEALIVLGRWLMRPFGVDRAYESFKPWLSIERHLTLVEHRELLLGAAYLAVGERRRAT